MGGSIVLRTKSFAFGPLVCFVLAFLNFMVSSAVVAAAKAAGTHYAGKLAKRLGVKSLRSGAKKLVKYGLKKVATKGLKYVSGKLGIESKPKFSKEASAKGAVNMIKRGVLKTKGTQAGAYHPGQMKGAKHLAATALGGGAYARKKIMPTSTALSYARTAGATKTRK